MLLALGPGTQIPPAATPAASADARVSAVPDDAFARFQFVAAGDGTE